MPAVGQTLAFSLHDEMEGQPLTPKNVDLLTLHQFMGEVIDLLQGDAKRPEMGHPTVAIEDGSVKLVSLVTPLVAAAFQADMQMPATSTDLDSISPKRAQVIEMLKTMPGYPHRGCQHTHPLGGTTWEIESLRRNIHAPQRRLSAG